MSATKFFLEKGFTPTFRSVTTEGAGTYEVWNPTTSTRIMLTELSVSSNLGGTILFSFGNLAGTKFAEFIVGSSATINPSIGAIESTMYDRSIFAAVDGGGTDGFKVNLMGFELK